MEGIEGIERKSAFEDIVSFLQFGIPGTMCVSLLCVVISYHALHDEQLTDAYMIETCVLAALWIVLAIIATVLKAKGKTHGRIPD